jgi:hypothetical protein
MVLVPQRALRLGGVEPVGKTPGGVVVMIAVVEREIRATEGDRWTEPPALACRIS